MFMWIFLVFFPKSVCILFTSNAELTELTIKTMRLMFSTIFMIGFQMVNQNAFVAMGNTKYSFIFGIMRKVILLVPLSLILPLFTGVWGVYAAEAISNPITTVITFIVFEKYMSELKNKFAQ